MMGYGLAGAKIGSTARRGTGRKKVKPVKKVKVAARKGPVRAKRAGTGRKRMMK
jgi:hypothetical protein